MMANEESWGSQGRRTLVKCEDNATPFYDPSFISRKTRGLSVPASKVVEEARASLSKPMRPMTPMDRNARSLFSDDDKQQLPGQRLQKAQRSKTPRRLVPIDPSALKKSESGSEEMIDIETLSLNDAALQMPVPPSSSPSNAKRPKSRRNKLKDSEGDGAMIRVQEKEALWDNISLCLQELKWKKGNEAMEYWMKMRTWVDRYMSFYDDPEVEIQESDIENKNEIVDSMITYFSDCCSDGYPFQHIVVAGGAILLRVGAEDAVLKHACQLMFMASKNAENDLLFKLYRVVDMLLMFIVKHTPFYLSEHREDNRLKSIEWLMSDVFESLVFAVGTIKNIANDQANLNQLLNLGCIDKLVEVMTFVMDEQFKSFKGQTLVDVSSKLLIQITGAFRNLAAHPTARSHLLRSGVIEMLLRCIDPDQAYSEYSELVLNIARVLSKLSLHPDCRDRMKGERSMLCMRRCVVKHSKVRAIVLRLCFVLGNMTSSVSEEHEYLAPSVQDFGELFAAYLRVWNTCNLDAISNRKRQSSASSSISAESESCHSTDIREMEDVITKMVRLLANLSLTPNNGIPIVKMKKQLEPLLSFLNLKSASLKQFIDTQEAPSQLRHDEEIVLNILGAFANFSWYKTVQRSSGSTRDATTTTEENVLTDDPHQNTCECGNFIMDRGSEVITSLSPLLPYPNPEIQIAILRTFSNLLSTDNPSYITAMLSCDALPHDLLNMLLQPDSREIQNLVCGVLMNSMKHEAWRRTWKIAGGLEALIDAIAKSTDERDYATAGLLCKVLCNYRVFEGLRNVNEEDSSTGETIFSAEQVQRINDALAECLDDNSDEYMTSVDSEFEEVALRLLCLVNGAEDEHGRILDDGDDAEAQLTSVAS